MKYSIIWPVLALCVGLVVELVIANERKKTYTVQTVTPPAKGSIVVKGNAIHKFEKTYVDAGLMIIAEGTNEYLVVSGSGIIKLTK